MKKYVFMILVISLLIVGCTTQKTISDSISEKKLQNETTIQKQIENKPSIVEKITETLSSEPDKIKSQVLQFNNENNTYFTNVDVTKKGKVIEVNAIVTPNATSKFLLNLVALGIASITYNTTHDFDTIKITYLDDKNRQLGIITVPYKAIDDFVTYAKANPNVEENPYMSAFWKVSSVMYDQSVPELFPKAMAEDIFGGTKNDAETIANALTKQVTHLEIECNSASNWDADADDDGITYYLKPLSADNTVVPIEGTFETKGYEQFRNEDYEYKKGSLVYTHSDSIKGKERLEYFDIYNGYNIRLDWDDVEPYMASSEENGIIYVIFTDLKNNKFEAKVGEGEVYWTGCKLRNE